MPKVAMEQHGPICGYGQVFKMPLTQVVAVGFVSDPEGPEHCCLFGVGVTERSCGWLAAARFAARTRRHGFIVRPQSSSDKMFGKEINVVRPPAGPLAGPTVRPPAGPTARPTAR